jgi:drug/metabolite transporter superfamily protein YnfA
VRPDRAEMWMPLVLFVVFTLLSIVGAYLVVAHWRGRRAGIVAAMLTALFFAALLAGVLALMRNGGMLQ